MIGQTIGSYNIVRKLGSGGMGEVYLAEHRRIARRAAIKVLRPEMSIRTKIIERFFNEARAASLIDHPNIVQVLDCDTLRSGRAFIVMELLQGENLAQYLKRCHSLPRFPRSVAALVGQIASGIAAAHEKGIVHRDLKPSNVFLVASESGISAKILDFGIAKLAAAGESATRTQSGTLLGTPVYMSPEQCRGSGAVDHRADIYSLGCIAFELLAGRPPFVLEGIGELLSAHLSLSPPPLDSLAKDLPPELNGFIASMLVKDPAARLPSMKAAVDWVQGFLGLPWKQFSAALAEMPDFPPPKAATDAAGTIANAAGDPTAATLIAPEAAVSTTSLSRLALGTATGSEVGKIGLSSGRRFALLVAIVLTLLGGVGLTLRRSLRPGSQAPTTGPPEAGARPTTVAPPQSVAVDSTRSEMVTLQVVSTPRSDVWLDTETVVRCHTPCRLSLPKKNGETTVRLRAPGFVDHVAAASTLADTVIDVQMQPVNSSSTPPWHNPGGNPIRRESPGARTPARASPSPERTGKTPPARTLPDALIDL